MKRLAAAICLAGAWGGLAGCANEGPTGQEVQEQLARGVRGEGQITADMDRTGDPYVKPREGRSVPAGGR